MSSGLKQGVEFSHWLMKQHLDRGDKVVDATLGRGRDTEFLAEIVGDSGTVWGFDVQQEAVKTARAHLQAAGLFDRVTLINDGHQNLTAYIDEPLAGIMFNLGYLPGSDKQVITQPETTLQAVKSGLELLETGGLITLVVYLGHSGGQKEQKELVDYVQELDEQVYNVLQYRFLNQNSAPPQVIAVKKRSREKNNC